MAVHSGYLIQQIFQEAGLPDGVIQFLPVENPVEMCKIVFEHRDFASLHFTGSTKVFKQLWADIGNNINKYKSYPRIVGETGELSTFIARGGWVSVFPPAPSYLETVTYTKKIPRRRQELSSRT